MSDHSKSLKLVQVISRHGNKGMDVWEGDILKFASLSEDGRTKMRSIGQFIKERYKGILGNNIDEFTATSSQVTRCVESAVEVLRGIYGDLESKTDEEIRSKVKTTFAPADKLLYPGFYSPEADLELKRAADKRHDFNIRHHKLLSKLSEKRSLATLTDFIMLRDSIQNKRLNGQPLPEDITEEIWLQLETVASEMPFVYFNREQFKIIRCSALIQQLTDNIDQVVDNKTEKKLHLFFTHDLTLIFLGLAMNTYNGIYPKFGDSFILELHQNNTGYSVVIYYLRVEDDGQLMPLFQIYPKETGKYKPIEDFKNDFEKYLKYQIQQEEIVEEKSYLLNASFFP